MSAFHDNALMGASGSQGYQISRSVRLRSSASAYFNRTQTAGSQTTWTWSGWVKRGKLGTSQYLMQAGGSSGSGVTMSVIADDFQIETGNGTTQYYARSTAQYRDPSAWYHVVMVCNTTSATSTLTGTPSDRLQIWVNGVQVTSFSASSIPTQNFAGYINQNTVAANIGRWNGATPNYYFDGYLTEVNFIDGQALTPSSFGENDTVTGVWKPKKYAGTYGTNGFYLNFSDNSNNTAATIGKDYSGNGNNWTPNNISVTSGTTYDSMLDVPTPYADGGNGRGNYAVLNPLDRNGTYGSVSDGNLTQAVSTANHAVVFSSMAMPTGKTYLEVTSGTTTSSTPLLIAFGLATQSAARTGYGNTNTWSIKCIDVKTLWNGGSSSSNFGSAFTSGTTMRLAYDSATGYLWIGDGSNWYNSTGGTTGDPAAGTNPSFTISTTEALFYFIDNYAGSGTVTSYTNFGQRPFSYTPPTGFKALNTFNLPEPTIVNGANYMAATTYTGTGATQTISNSANGVSFQPDLVWTKARSAAIAGLVYDSVRGATKYLQTNSTGAEGTGADSLTAFASNGFTVGADTSTTGVNQNTTTYVGWQWKAGGTSSSNTNGSITSTVSVNTTAGFSVVTYTGTGANATVGHGLGVAPSMIILKPRNAADNWPVWHSSFAVNEYVYLNLTNAKASLSTFMNSTLPSSTVFSLGTWSNTNTNAQTMVAYCFAEVAGYSKFGSYTGNGSSDGVFVFLGFRPRWLMVKRTNTTGDWELWDTSRDTYNATGNALLPNSSQAESYYAAVDILSNGFKLRDGSLSWNSSGSTYIYAAFAENPMKFSLAR